MAAPPVSATLHALRALMAGRPDLTLTTDTAAYVAFAVTGKPRVTAEDIARALQAFGYLVRKVDLATFAYPRVLLVEGEHLCLAPGVSLGERFAANLALMRARPRPAPPKAAPPKAAPPKPAPPKAAPPKTAPPKAAPSRSGARTAAAGPAVRGKGPSAPPPAPMIPVRPPAPPAAPHVPAPRTWLPLDAVALAQDLSRAPSPPEALLHTLEAHALAAAEHFEDLLALGTLTGVEPHTYQLETVRRVLRQLRGRALLADEVGLGKTVEAIMALREYQLRGMVRRALVLVPPALMGQWEAELRQKAGVVAHVANDPDPTFWRRDGVLLVSQALARMPRHAPIIQEQAWDLVIVDEAHRFKSRTTQSWKLVDGLRSRFLLMLTATPVESDLEELYNLVTLLKPGQLSTLGEFKRRYVDARDPTAPKDAARLKALLAEVMVRNTRASCGLSLPPRFVTTVSTEPSAPERALYDGVVALLRRHRQAGRRLADTLMLEAGSSPAAVRATLSRVKDEGPLADDVATLRTLADQVEGTAKGAALLDIFAAHREKILVFTRFRETLGYVEALARRAGVAAAVVHGGLDRARKEEAFRAFRGDTPLLLCTDVGSEGQNLQHAHVLVNFDLPWSPMVIEQRIGRLHRYGQTEPVRVYNLCARGTAEERLLDVLDRRVHLFELVVGEMDMVVGNLVDQEDLEERVLAIYAASRSDSELALGFDAIAADLAKARGQLEKVQKLDEQLFGQEFEA